MYIRTSISVLTSLDLPGICTIYYSMGGLGVVSHDQLTPMDHMSCLYPSGYFLCRVNNKATSWSLMSGTSRVPLGHCVKHCRLLPRKCHAHLQTVRIQGGVWLNMHYLCSRAKYAHWAWQAKLYTAKNCSRVSDAMLHPCGGTAYKKELGM
jgi:hypothetical protein